MIGDPRGAGLVCPQCRSEYRQGIDTCAECLVGLVEMSSLVVSHDVAEYDLADWSQDNFDALLWRLRNESIAFEALDRAVRVSSATAGCVDELVDLITAAEALPEAVDEPSDAPPLQAASPSFASPARRAVAWFLDGIVWWTVATLLLATGAFISGVHGRTVAVSLASGVFLIYKASSIALWGQTLGNRMTRTFVERNSAGEPAGWQASLVRISVVLVPYFGGFLFPLGVVRQVYGIVDTVWILAVVLSIPLNPERRGIHDRLAGTAVVNLTQPG